MPRNIELKARYADLAAARQIALDLGCTHGGVEEQTDTYFAVADGRLKLREIAGGDARLVEYRRANANEARASDYTLTQVADPVDLKKRLAVEHGICGIVRKRREIFFYDNVRIHLDEVEGLSTFIEFEAVLGDGVDDARGGEQVAFLRSAFGIGADALIGTSYRDLIAANPRLSG
jgi:predicted adenylyl cyclase CyaB